MVQPDFNFATNNPVTAKSILAVQSDWDGVAMNTDPIRQRLSADVLTVLIDRKVSEQGCRFLVGLTTEDGNDQIAKNFGIDYKFRLLKKHGVKISITKIHQFHSSQIPEVCLLNFWYIHC